MKFHKMIHVFNILEENPLRSLRTLRLIFFFISGERRSFYNFLSNKNKIFFGV
jgi:hypothetical protein